MVKPIALAAADLPENWVNISEPRKIGFICPYCKQVMTFTGHIHDMIIKRNDKLEYGKYKITPKLKLSRRKNPLYFYFDISKI